MASLYLIMKQEPVFVKVDSVFSTYDEATNYCDRWYGNCGTGMWKSFDTYYYIEKLEFEPRVNFGP